MIVITEWHLTAAHSPSKEDYFSKCFIKTHACNETKAKSQNIDITTLAPFKICANKTQERLLSYITLSHCYGKIPNEA